MEWTLKWGKDEEYLRELESEGREVPALERRPALTGIQDTAVEAFWLLSHGRPMFSLGMGGAAPGGIPAADIILTALSYGLTPDWFLRMVRIMDAAYLSHHYDVRQSKEKRQPPKRARRT